MSIDDVRDAIAGDSSRDKWIGVWIGVLAVLLAICGVGGGNATKDANRANIDAANTWAFFQAKNIRRHAFEIAADEMELTLQAMPAAPPEARAAIAAKVKSWRTQAHGYKSDPKSKEGLDELFQRGKALEVERDQALRKDPYFDLSQALLQIAIVLASVAIIAGTNLLLVASILVGALGGLLLVDGFTLLVALPFLG